MSITRRILESTQSGFSKLTSLVIADDEPLSHVEAAALQIELAARKAARARTPRASLDNPLAKLATSDPSARATRERAARERAARIHKDRDDRAARQKVAADDAFRRMKDQAARGTWSTGPTPGSSSGSSTGASSARAPRPGSPDAQVADWYKVLDVSPGADMAQIKSAYRQMMRKYHPDMHAGNPQKLKAATELSVRVTTAYNGLVMHLEKRRDG
ncbi:MAG: J domain-containing protein [Proteobacteria bacterium]|nr:J domain-containing protein [Pseudomonadota bacterium]